MKTWLTDFNLSHPFVIAGSAEEQVLKIAHELKDSDVSVLERITFTRRPFEGGWRNRLWLLQKKNRIVNGTKL
jgi:chorismate mutase